MLLADAYATLKQPLVVYRRLKNTVVWCSSPVSISPFRSECTFQILWLHERELKFHRFIYREMCVCLISLPLMLIICVTGFPYDLRPRQCHGAYHEPDRYDAATVSLGWLSAVPGPHAAGLPTWLLGHQEQDGGKWSVDGSDSSSENLKKFRIWLYLSHNLMIVVRLLGPCQSNQIKWH